jgi:hypothetical protein
MDESTSSALANCNCCEGISQETPQVTFNRPGLDAIAYRIGTWQQFRDTLLARLQLSRQPFLTQLKARETNDFTIALLDSFSTVADVLTFYTERYQNESYLRTAQERLSVLNLAALVGYQMSPGVAASTYLAFTLDPTSGAYGSVLAAPTTAQVLPDSAANVLVDVGTRVQSIPGPGETAQTFETVEAIQARAEWNAMTPLLRQKQEIRDNATTLLLSGAVSNLKPGDKILMLPKGDSATGFRLTAVLKVEVQPDGKTTQLHLEGWQDGTAGYLPSKFELPKKKDCDDGQSSDIPANSNLNQVAINTILSRRWDSEALVALLNTQKWSLDQLSTALNQDLSDTLIDAPATGAAFVLRQQVATFGHNAPYYYSLQPNLRFKTRFRTSTGTQVVPAAYPKSWEDDTLFTLGGNQSVYLDSTYPAIVAKSWIVLQKPQGAPKSEVVQVTSNTEVAHTDFSLSAKVSLLELATTASLDKFPVRTTSVLCQSEPLNLAPVPIDDEVFGNVIPLDKAYIGLLPQRVVAISGERFDLPGVTVGEIRTLQKVELVCGVTVITLDQSLQFKYVRSTVQINANVALATNGSTFQEVLGNGDGTQAFQSFLLHQPPLTYVGASTPSGTQTTLQVRVNSLLWKEVPYLYGHGPEEQIYIVRHDNKRNSTVTFGDGVTGSRLPTGLANVAATYRCGIGTGGEVRSNQLSQLTSRPLGVRSVNNPLLATGAADPEDLDDGRQNANLKIRTLDRIVSLEDYQDFARAFAGISKALVSWSWNGEQRIIVLTVAGTDGETIDPESHLASDLTKAIANCSEPGTILKLLSYDPKLFRIAGTVDISPDYLLDQVTANIENTLRQKYSFAKREFGQAVHRSEVIATIQNVPGVIDVDLLSFYRSDQVQSLEVHIPAAIPQPGGTDFFPAQLLTLDPAPLGLKEKQ